MAQFCQGILSFGSSICKLFLGTCLFNQLVKFHISSLQDSIEQGICLPKKPADILRCHYQDLGNTSVHQKANFPHGTTNQKHNLDRWEVISMKFLCLSRWHYFMRKPVVSSQNFAFLRLWFCLTQINLGFWETAHLPLPYAIILPQVRNVCLY